MVTHRQPVITGLAGHSHLLYMIIEPRRQIVIGPMFRIDE
jgi:hypothetical protein